jgi:hypothetical protein
MRDVHKASAAGDGANQVCLASLRQTQDRMCLETYWRFFTPGKTEQIASSCTVAAFDQQIEIFKSLMSPSSTGSATALLNEAVNFYNEAKGNTISLALRLNQVDDFLRQYYQAMRAPASVPTQPDDQ